MTTAAEELQSLAAASFGAWVRLTTTWVEATNDVWRALAEWAYDEALLDPAFTGDAVVQSDRDSPLQAVLSHAYTREPLPEHAVTVTPAAALAGRTHVVSVRVAQGGGIAPGVYHGHLVDEDGRVVSDDLNVTVLCP
jgi:hypothetical protein